MLELTLLTLNLFGQAASADTPSMQFTNRTGVKVTVRIFCEQHQQLANNGKELEVGAGATVKLALHEGYFKVSAVNDDQQTAGARRVLKTGELDWLDFSGIYGDPPGRRPVQKFRITEHKL